MGKVTVVGGKVGMEAPSGGILTSELAVGSTVKLMENGSPVEYLVVNQGKPAGSSLYDASCDGTWLLRKDIIKKEVWSYGGSLNSYGSSAIHTYLNNEFIEQLGSIEKSTVKQVKIPYCSGFGNSGSLNSGESGLSTKAFLLSLTETFAASLNIGNCHTDGVCLSYFSGFEMIDSGRVGYMDGVATPWWLRSAYKPNATHGFYVQASGDWGSQMVGTSYGVRPALILPYTASFDPVTMLLKEVA